VYDSFSEPARQVMALAETEARTLGHAHLGTEHLLLALMMDEGGRVARDLARAGATLHPARAKVAEAVGRNSADPGGVRPGDAGGAALPLTPRASRALERASRFCFQRRHGQVQPVHILLGVLDVEGTAGQVLRGLGVDVGQLHDLVESDEPELSEPARVTIQVPPAAGAERRAPRCQSCGVGLEAVLAHRVLTARDPAGVPRAFLVSYCSACGAALGAAPAPTGLGHG
jgi:ATP-dependent Clp protease ATP-binding subunit ClpA